MSAPHAFLPTLAAALIFIAGPLVHAADTAPVGSTEILKWKDGKAAAFLLMFDDSWPSHWQVAAPELAKRGMIATFYICPGKGEHQTFSAQWDEKLWKSGMIYGVHTMTHKGVTDLENAEWEIGENARIIRKISSGKAGRLVSYGQPGVAPDAWKITEEQLDGLLTKYQLISRPTFVGHGAVYHLKTTQEMLALADKAIAQEGMEYLVIHGVERITPDWGYQDMWPLSQEVFLHLLDGLKERCDKGQLWITDHISMVQYETERNSAEARVLEMTGTTIRLELKCQADPQLYDHPLTLSTRVQEDWKRCVITQGARREEVVANSGVVRYSALPGTEPITIQTVSSSAQ